jgi:hypothetical protein
MKFLTATHSAALDSITASSTAGCSAITYALYPYTALLSFSFFGQSGSNCTHLTLLHPFDPMIGTSEAIFKRQTIYQEITDKC